MECDRCEALYFLTGLISEEEFIKIPFSAARKKAVLTVGCYKAHIPYIAAAFYHIATKGIFLAMPDASSANSIYEDMLAILGFENILRMGMFQDENLEEKDIESQANFFNAISAFGSGRKYLFVMSRSELEQRIPSDAKGATPFVIEAGFDVDHRELIKWLEEAGYSRTHTVEEWGTYAVRGGIVDIYDPISDMPIRVEFSDSGVERIDLYEVATQRSSGKTKSALLQRLSFSSGASRATIFETAQEYCELVLYVRGEEPENGDLKKTDIRKMSDNLKCEAPFLALGDFDKPDFSSTLLPAPILRTSVSERVKDIEDLLNAGNRIIIAHSNRYELQRVLKSLADRGIHCSDEFSGYSQVTACGVALSEGIILPSHDICLLTSGELFCRRVKIARNERKRELSLLEVSSSGKDPLSLLSEGDYVVHYQYGIGIYRGLETVQKCEDLREYMVIDYAEGDVLRVPLERLDMLFRYSGGDKPQIKSLSSAVWKRARKKVETAVEEIALELLDLYAKREVISTEPFGLDGELQEDFENAFPHTLTNDQEKAAAEVKADMESESPMDRLIYGDVGFGKTEIAVRAAFKSVMSGKQVAVLCPTTILAQQHFYTFAERMEPFGVKVSQLSRLTGYSEKRALLQKLESGMVDVLIGTHTLLSEKVRFFDLGLLVLDEEHRFGVKQKENIRKRRLEVDVLTLSATPIPRTLQMSLAGIRDISMIDTPIAGRIPVSTHIGEYDEALISSVIRREIARGGKVFYIFNRIETIEARALKLAKMIPEASIGIGHGRMNKKDLDGLMTDFSRGVFDVLVATTIVESGIDMPDTNTMIIENAHRMGLAQLYHLRGRVGRRSKQAYAYLFYPKGTKMTEKAVERLKAIKRFSGLSSGLRVSLCDLEIRGAGNLLGVEQHGHIAAVGFDLFCQMLADEVKRIREGTQRTEKILESKIVDISAGISAILPEGYIGDLSDRIDIYRKIVKAEDFVEIEDLADEVRDRFGRMPREAGNLFEVGMLRVAAMKANAKGVFIDNERIIIEFRNPEKARQIGARLSRLIGEAGSSHSFDDFRSAVCIDRKPTALLGRSEELEAIRAIRDALISIGDIG